MKGPIINQFIFWYFFLNSSFVAPSGKTSTPPGKFTLETCMPCLQELHHRYKLPTPLTHKLKFQSFFSATGAWNIIN